MERDAGADHAASDHDDVGCRRELAHGSALVEV
jgi:hypothetical protein